LSDCFVSAFNDSVYLQRIGRYSFNSTNLGDSVVMQPLLFNNDADEL